jgi:hypothetical protein
VKVGAGWMSTKMLAATLKMHNCHPPPPKHRSPMGIMTGTGGLMGWDGLLRQL